MRKIKEWYISVLVKIIFFLTNLVGACDVGYDFEANKFEVHRF